MNTNIYQTLWRCRNGSLPNLPPSSSMHRGSVLLLLLFGLLFATGAMAQTCIRVTSTCTNIESGQYASSGTPEGKPRFFSSTGNTRIHFYSDNKWYITSGSTDIAYNTSSSGNLPPTTGWVYYAATSCGAANAPADVTVNVGQCLAVGPCYTVTTGCGNMGGNYQDIGQTYNGRPDIYDEDGNDIYWSGSIWYLYSTTLGYVFQNSSTSATPPTDGWVPIAGEACVGASISVVQNPVLVPSVSIVANPSGSITAGTSVTFTATPTNGGTTPTYVWKKNNVTIPNETGATLTTTTLADRDNIKVEMTSSDACASPTTATSNEITMVVGSACPSDGTLWQERTAAEANPWTSVAYGNGLFVAVSDDGTNRVMTSPDGITWTAQTAAQNNSWKSVTFANGLFVAVSSYGNAMTSPNGINWTTRTVPEFNDWSSVTYGNGLFVAVAQYGNAMTSPDGINWTTQTVAETNPWRSVTYGNGLFVAVADGGTNRVMTSPDGINWTAYTAAENNSWRSVTYGNGLFVAVANGGLNRVMTSPDGINWTAYFGAVLNSWTAVSYANGLFVAVGQTLSMPRVMTGTDGINWTAQSTPEISNLSAVTYGNGQFVTVGTSRFANQVMTSKGTAAAVSIVSNEPDNSFAPGTSVTFTATPTNGGSTPVYQWKKNDVNVGTNSTTYTDNALANGDVITVEMVSNDPCVAEKTVLSNRIAVEVIEPACSPSGVTWTGRSAPGSGWRSVSYVNGLYVAVARSGNSRIMTSPDGINWTGRLTPADNNWRSVTYGNGLFVAVSDNASQSTGRRVMTSPDGITWTLRITPPNTELYSVTFGNGIFVAVGTFGTNNVVTSTDGITWTARPSATTASWDAVTYGGGLFVAVVGYESTPVMTSPDGITWTARTFDARSGWQSVTYGNGRFVAVAESGPNRTMTSTDGINWTVQTGGIESQWWSVAYGDNKFIAVASSGDTRVMTSTDGLNWTPQTAAENNEWRGVTFGPGLFVAVSENGSSKVMTSRATITVTPSVAIAANPSGSITASTSVTFTATPTNGGTTPTYVWKKNNVTIPNETGATYTTTTLANGDKIKVEMTSSDACATPTLATSNEITMAVCSTPTAYNLTGGGAYCAGGTGAAVGLASSQTGVNYQLKKDNVNEGDPVAGTGAAISFGNKTAAGTYTVVATTVTGNCNANMTGSVTITINPLPTATLAGGATICQNTASPNITFTGSAGKAPYTFTYNVNGGGNQTVITTDGNSVTVAVPTNNAGTFTYNLLSVSDANSCEQAQSGTAVVTVNPIHVLTLTSAAKSVGGCINAPISPITFALSGGATGANVSGLPTGVTGSVNGNTLTISGTPSVSGVFNYSIVTTGNECATASEAGTITLNTKPTFTLSVNGQSFNEGNNPTLCDTDANPVNGLQFAVSTSCVSGPVLWRTQVGGAAWADWSTNAPSSQPSNNIAYKYQAACDAACPSNLSGIITLTINYRAATPQNVSLVADGTTVAAGEAKTICNLEGNTLTFNATCASGEILLYSVDGGEYSSTVPSQIVDNNFHNYRVRCRKADGTPSCVETESAAMSLKITTPAAAPVVSITPTSNCGTPTAFAGSSSCGTLVTIWYNATTNQTLPTLPTTTPNATTSYYARCQNEAGCESEKSNVVTFTITPVNEAPVVTVSADLVCAGTEVTVSTNCPAGTTALWNTGVTEASFKVAFNNVTKATYWAKCIAPNGCQSPESNRKTVSWKGFELTFINVGQSGSATKANDKAAWASQFITPDAGPSLDYSTEANPTIYFSENVNKTAPRFWTIHAETCNLGTDGSLTFNLLATPELGIVRSYNTHENNAPYFMYANRAGFTELYAQNHPAYGFFADNGNGGNVYDEGLPKGLYKLGVRYWDQKGQGSIYPSTRQPAGTVLAYQEYWFRIQSKNGIGTGSAKIAADNGQWTTDNGDFAQVMPNPVSNILHLKVNDAKDQKVNVSLLDASGRTLLQRAFVPQTNQHQEEFEVSQLSNGMYFLKVNTADKQTTLKVVKVQ